MIAKYKDLIQQLPIDEHGFPIERETWIKFEEKYEWYKEMNDLIFGKNEVISITRKRLKELGQTHNYKRFIFEVIYWGYPKGYTDPRNIQLENLLKGIENWVKLVESLKKEREIKDFRQYYKKNVIPVKGLGLSTFTKLLYFSGAKVNGEEPLILDSQIISRLTISQFKNDKFSKLSYSNGAKFYDGYLAHIKDLATEIGSTPERIELFLFVFGGIIFSETDII